MSGEKKDTSSSSLGPYLDSSLELMIPHNDPIGVPSNSNLITITAHGARHGDKIIKVPENVYIISPCSDDLSWSRYYWLGSKDDQIKACNKLDYEDLGGALDDRCLVEQLSRFEKMALYSNKGNLFERYPVETIRRNHLDRAIENIADGKKDDRAQWNSLIRNTTDKALHYIFPSLTRGADMNVIFQDICRTGSNFKTDQCTRFCVNGPGTYVKNQTYSGSYQPTERVYGSKVRYFKNSTGEKVEVILRGRLNDEKKKVDPEGYKKVEQAMASAGPELTEKIINRISLEDILFYYKNFGINAFKKSNEPVMSRDKPNTNIVNNEPLIIFLGDPCRADRLLGLGVEEKYFIDFSKIKSDEQYRKIIMRFRDWFNDSHIRIGMSNIISIDYLPENLSQTAYISGLSSITGAWKRDIRNQNITIIQKKLSPRPTSLRSSTNITTDHVTVKGPNSHLYNDTHEILLESPCSRTRPRLNEYMTDVRSRETRSMRNITSNDIARNEIFLCEQLKKLGLGVGSRLAIVLKLSEIPQLENDSSSPDLLSSSIANNRSDIVFTDKERFPILGETTLAENYLSIIDKYDFTYFTGKSQELVEIRNKKKSQTQRQTRKKRRTKSRKNKTITFRYRDYPQWDCVIFTEIRGIENNALVLGIKSSNNYRENIIEGDEKNLQLCFKALINKFNIPQRNLNYFMYTNYGDIGFQSHSLFNINPEILNFCYWDIDSKLTDSFVDGEKNINRSKVYKDLLDRNIKSRRYKGDPELQNIELSAYRDRMVRETNLPLEQLSKVPDLFDYEGWKCNKFIKNDDGRWVPCNAVNHEEEEDCYKCGQDKWTPPIRKSTEVGVLATPPRISLRTTAATRSTEMIPTLEQLKQSGIDLSTVVNKTPEQDDIGSVQYGHVRELIPNIPPPIRSIHSESKRGGKRKNKKTKKHKTSRKRYKRHKKHKTRRKKRKSMCKKNSKKKKKH